MAQIDSAYLAAGSTVILTGNPASPGAFRQRDLRFPAPQPNAFGGWLNAVRVAELDVVGTGPEIDAAITSLHRACVRGALLSFKARSTSELRQSRIISAHIAVPDYDPSFIATAGAVQVTLTITTEPHWMPVWDPWTTVASPTAAPYHFDVPAAGGEDDALMCLRLIPGIATNGIYVGGQPSPAAGYDYLDNTYSGTLAIDSSWKRFTSGAAAVNALANRGRHLPLAYTVTNVVTTTMGIRSALVTAGHAIASTTPVTGLDRIADTQGRAVEILPITLPGTSIPENINGDSFATTHYLEFTDDNINNVNLTAVQRIPLDYAALAYRAVSTAGVGIVYDGDTGCVHVADADGIGGTALTAADVIRPLRAAPNAVTRFVYGVASTTYPVNASITALAYRVRRRYLSAMG